MRGSIGLEVRKRRSIEGRGTCFARGSMLFVRIKWRSLYVGGGQERGRDKRRDLALASTRRPAAPGGGNSREPWSLSGSLSGSSSGSSVPLPLGRPDRGQATPTTFFLSLITLRLWSNSPASTRQTSSQPLKMLICRACARRTANSLLRRIPAKENRTKPPSRAFATNTIRRRPEPEDDWGELEAVAEMAETSAISRDGREAVAAKNAEKLKWAARKELQHTTDPFHIADRVLSMLKNKDFEKALTLTREASKHKQVVVSWNHLIEHQFDAQSLHAAVKLYGEVSRPPPAPLSPPVASSLTPRRR